MTIGIYALRFSDDSLYVGQSNNIESRYKGHCAKLRKYRHYNYKLQDKFNSLNYLPDLIILEICSLDMLDKLEISWAEELDTIFNGLNIVPAGISGGSGTEASSSKYSKLDILKVFILLIRTNKTAKQIEDRTKVNRRTVRNIRIGTQHLWLQEQFPEEYEIMRLKSKSVINRWNVSEQKHTLIDSKGVATQFSSIRDFCKTYLSDKNIDVAARGISELLQNKRKTSYGYTNGLH